MPTQKKFSGDSETSVTPTEAINLPAPTPTEAPAIPTVQEALDLDDLADELLEFFNKDKHLRVQETVISKSGDIETIHRLVPDSPPMLSAFAHKYGLTKREIEELATHSPKLAKALEIAEEIVKEFLVHFGLLGDYNSTFATFAATNLTDMRDRKQIDVRRLNINAKIKEIEEEGDPLIRSKDGTTRQPKEISERAVSLPRMKNAAQGTMLFNRPPIDDGDESDTPGSTRGSQGTQGSVLEAEQPLQD